MSPPWRRWSLPLLVALPLLLPLAPPALADETGALGSLVTPWSPPEPPHLSEEPPPPPPPPPPAPDDLAVEFARAQVGMPYVYAGDGPPEDLGFDCSGLVHQAYARAYDRTGGRPPEGIPRTANSFWHWGQRVGLEEANPGDLLFWNYGGGKIDHVAIVTENNWIVEASTYETGVRERQLRSHEPNLIGAVRPPRTA